MPHKQFKPHKFPPREAMHQHTLLKISQLWASTYIKFEIPHTNSRYNNNIYQNYV